MTIYSVVVESTLLIKLTLFSSIITHLKRKLSIRLFIHLTLQISFSFILRYIKHSISYNSVFFKIYIINTNIKSVHNFIKHFIIFEVPIFSNANYFQNNHSNLNITFHLKLLKKMLRNLRSCVVKPNGSTENPAPSTRQNLRPGNISQPYERKNCPGFNAYPYKQKQGTRAAKFPGQEKDTGAAKVLGQEKDTGAAKVPGQEKVTSAAKVPGEEKDTRAAKVPGEEKDTRAAIAPAKKRTQEQQKSPAKKRTQEQQKSPAKKKTRTGRRHASPVPEHNNSTPSSATNENQQVDCNTQQLECQRGAVPQDSGSVECCQHRVFYDRRYFWSPDCGKCDDKRNRGKSNNKRIVLSKSHHLWKRRLRCWRCLPGLENFGFIDAYVTESFTDNAFVKSHKSCRFDNVVELISQNQNVNRAYLESEEFVQYTPTPLYPKHDGFTEMAVLTAEWIKAKTIIPGLLRFTANVKKDERLSSRQFSVLNPTANQNETRIMLSPLSFVNHDCNPNSR